MTAATPTKWAEVDLAAIADNSRALKSLTGPQCQMMAMVKANGYGHGMVAAARAALAGGADWLGVSSITEGLELRASGIDVPVLNVGWTPADDMEVAADAGIDVTVFTREAVQAANQAGEHLGRPVHVQWKLDTGMARLGTPAASVPGMFAALRKAAHVHVRGMFTHFSSADAPALDQTYLQHRRFLELVEHMRASFPDALVHCANSAAMLRLPQTHHDLTRPGIALYGYPPPHCEGIVELRPALTVKAVVSQVKAVAAGDTVGYGGTWSAPVDSVVATFAVGYADGFDRRNGIGGQVLVKGVLCPVVGRVSMDQAAADVSAAGEVDTGTEVTVLGPGGAEQVDAAAVAERIGTIPNEVLCAVAARVPRIAVSRPS